MLKAIRHCLIVMFVSISEAYIVAVVAVCCGNISSRIYLFLEADSLLLLIFLLCIGFFPLAAWWGFLIRRGLLEVGVGFSIPLYGIYIFTFMYIVYDDEVVRKVLYGL